MNPYVLMILGFVALVWLYIIVAIFENKSKKPPKTMKKITYLLFAILLSSCNVCMLAQIPPQKLYVSTGCSAPIIDYKTKVTASDNCEISSFTQVPAPGFMLTPTNKVATVTLKATDGSGNFSQVVFTVTLVDTIKPKLTIDPSLLSGMIEDVKEIYDVADRSMAYWMQYYEKTYPVTNVGRRNFIDSAYYKYNMVMTVSPNYAFTGYGKRVFNFTNPDQP
jgi:uncharacterized OB-fold protein